VQSHEPDHAFCNPSKMHSVGSLKAEPLVNFKKGDVQGGGGKVLIVLCPKLVVNDGKSPYIYMKQNENRLMITWKL